MYISIEGIDGVGKSTAVKVVESWLAENFPDRELFRTREPGGCQEAEEIRDYVLNNDMSDATRLALMFGARTVNLHTDVLPALREGKVVLSDRCYASSFAYQATSPELKDMFDMMHYHIVKPDLIIILDAPVSVCMQRMADDGKELDKIESVDLAELEARRERYRDFARSDEKCVVISTEGTVGETACTIVRWLDAFLK